MGKPKRGITAVSPTSGVPMIVAPPRSATRSRPYPAKAGMVLGVSQVVLGLLCIIAQSVLIAKHSIVGVAGLCYIAAVLFIVTGAIGIGASKRKSKCLAVAFLVLNIISASFCALVFAVSSIGIAVDHDEYPNNESKDRYYDSHRYPDYPCDYGQYGNDWDRKDYVDYGDEVIVENSTRGDPDYDYPEYENLPPCPVYPVYHDIYWDWCRKGLKLVLSMHGLLLVFGLFELVIAIVASAIGCKVLCNCQTNEPAAYAIVVPSGYGYPAPEVLASPTTAGRISNQQPLMAAVAPQNPRTNHGLYPISIPMDMEPYPTDAGASARPPSYTSLPREDQTSIEKGKEGPFA